MFRPTDIEVGPDGALYMAGWGSVYGTEYVPAENGQPRKMPSTRAACSDCATRRTRSSTENGTRPSAKTLAEWTFDELIEDIGHQLQVWRVNAQDELVRRGAAVRKPLIDAIDSGNLTEAQATWSVWALGHIDGRSGNSRTITDYALANREAELNAHSGHAHPWRKQGQGRDPGVVPCSTTRSRGCAWPPYSRLAKWAGAATMMPSCRRSPTRPTDWHFTAPAGDAPSAPAREASRPDGDDRAGIRLMAALGLMEERRHPEQIFALQDDGDLRIGSVANDWLQKTGTRKATSCWLRPSEISVSARKSA